MFRSTALTSTKCVLYPDSAGCVLGLVNILPAPGAMLCQWRALTLFDIMPCNGKGVTAPPAFLRAWSSRCPCESAGLSLGPSEYCHLPEAGHLHCWFPRGGLGSPGQSGSPWGLYLNDRGVFSPSPSPCSESRLDLAVTSFPFGV